MSGDPTAGLLAASPIGHWLGMLNVALTGHSAVGTSASSFTQLLTNDPSLIFVLLAIGTAAWLTLARK
jgi:hypothetical protein